MKLNPPASSSDLEIAREIALRLHESPRRGEAGAPAPSAPPAREVASASPGPAAAPAHAAPPPLPRARPAPAAPLPSPTPPPLPSAPPAPVTATPTAPNPIEPAPAWDETPPPPWEDAPPSPPSDALEIEMTPVSLEDTTDQEERSPFDDPEARDAGAGPSPLEVEADELGAPPEVHDLSEAPSPFDTELSAPPEMAPDDLFAAPPPPSWDEVIEACFEVSQASGAMLIDPAGQVFAARGEWPDPGAEAIAAKLVPMLDRTLKDAPTRSVSAPVAGRHLTAWRVPLAEGLVTVAFVGHTPLHAELRPVIDDQIHRGAGA